MTGVKQHVLRYWESEFPPIRPQKSKSNQRLYRRRDVEAVLAVKHLLYDRKFTIEGAKKHLKAEGIDTSLPPPDPKEVAAKAREKALKEVDDAVERTRAKLQGDFEKHLLELKQRTVEFLRQLDAEDR